LRIIWAKGLGRGGTGEEVPPRAKEAQGTQLALHVVQLVLHVVQLVLPKGDLTLAQGALVSDWMVGGTAEERRRLIKAERELQGASEGSERATVLNTWVLLKLMQLFQLCRFDFWNALVELDFFADLRMLLAVFFLSGF
jgi:hypothetical protein